jgi:hypothetical protein
LEESSPVDAEARRLHDLRNDALNDVSSESISSSPKDDGLGQSEAHEQLERVFRFLTSVKLPQFLPFR